MKPSFIASGALAGTLAYGAHAFGQTATPEGIMKQDAASSGSTAVATETFEAGAKPPDEAKDDTEGSALVDQLAEGGRMLIPVGGREAQELVMVRREGGEVTEETVGGECTFVPLLGRFAWVEAP